MSPQFAEAKAKVGTHTKNDKKYEIEIICDRELYKKEAVKQLSRLYYLVSWKGYIKVKSTLKLVLAIMHLHKMISTLDKNHSKKLIAMLPLIDSILYMIKPTAQLFIDVIKRIYKQPTKSFVKQGKKV